MVLGASFKRYRNLVIFDLFSLKLKLDSSSSHALSGPLPATNSFLGKRKRQLDEEPKSAVMSLYLHNIVTHIPEMFECMDFKNSNTERFEGFLAFVKKTLNDSTNRNPS